MGRRVMRPLASIASLAAFLVAWKLLTIVTGTPGYILPPPEVVGERALRAIGSGVLWEHLWATLSEVVPGFALGALAAVAVGVALGKSVVIERVLSPYIVAAQAVPVLALAPLLDIWFGGGLMARVLVVALIVFFPIAIATMVGIRSADPRLREMLRSLGATSGQVTARLEIPAALQRAGRAHQHRRPRRLRHPAHVRRARHAGRHRPGVLRPGGPGRAAAHPSRMR